MIKRQNRLYKTAKYIGYATLVLMLGLSIFLAPIIWGKPWTVNQLGMKALVVLALDNPELLSHARIFERFRLDWYSSKLNDRSMEHREEMSTLISEFQSLLNKFNREQLNEDEKISFDTLNWLLVEAEASKPFLHYDYQVDQLSGVQSNLPDFMVNVHKVNNKRDAIHYVERTAAFDHVFNQVLVNLKYKQQNGIIPPRFVIKRVIKEMSLFIASPIEKHIIYTHLEARLEEIKLQEQDKQKLLHELKNILESEVYPSYIALINHHKTLLNKSTTDDGVWKLPRGDEYYARQLKFWTTTNYSPQEIHNIGISKVNEIQTEMIAILASQGLKGASLSRLMKTLSKNPQFQYSIDNTSKKEILDDYQKIIDEISGKLSPFFEVSFKAPVQVKAVPAFKEKGAPGAYYMPPSLDGSVPGTFYANLRDIKDIRKYNMRTLAYHEAVPGHHMQIAISLENWDIPLFRRVLPFGAYTEGWALYAETLAAEQGFQENPFDRLGYLNAQLFRAVRLVVDTGIHHKRWTREQAITYMKDNTGMLESSIVPEIERYIVQPGQACSYMIGQLKIMEIRKNAKNKLGDQFDLREFHNVILLNGMLPLDILERVVDSWILKKR